MNTSWFEDYETRRAARPWYQKTWEWVEHWFFWRWYGKIENAWDETKWGFQRMFRGYDETVNWSLPHYLNSIILVGLRHFKEHEIGYPFQDDDTNSWEKWAAILDEMILGFSLLEAEDRDVFDKDTYLANQPKIERALYLFGKYYRCLWC